MWRLSNFRLINLFCFRLFFYFSFRFGFKTNDRKSDDWSNWRVWVAVHSSVVHEKCVVFQWIYRLVWTMAVAFHISMRKENLNLVMVDHHFMHTMMVHSSRDIQSDRCHSMDQVRIVIHHLNPIKLLSDHWNYSIRLLIRNTNSIFIFSSDRRSNGSCWPIANCQWIR